MKKRSRLKLALGLVLALFLALNAFAYVHAYKMTHFVDAGERTVNPEELGIAEKLEVLLTGVSIPKPRAAPAPRLEGTDQEKFTIAGYQGALLDVCHFRNELSNTSLLLFHGYAGEQSQVAREAREFLEASYDVYTVDFHGSGGSSGETTSIGYHEAEDVRALYDEVRRRRPEAKLVLYGVSMGASAIVTAIHRFELAPEAAILAAPFSSLLDTTRNRFETMGIPAFPAAQLLTFWGGFQHDFDGFTYQPAEYAKSIDVPILQLHGAADTRVTTEQALRVFDAFRGPKTWVLFTESGHESFPRSEPAKWRASVLAFLETL